MPIKPIKNGLKKAWLKSDLRGIETIKIVTISIILILLKSDLRGIETRSL